MSYKQNWISWKEQCDINYSLPNLNSFHSELINNSITIRETFSGKLDLLFSGGNSSQVALYSFLEAGIPVNLITANFSNLNLRDVNSAIEISKNLNLQLKIIDIDIESFFENEAEAIFEKAPCFNINNLLITKLLSFCDNTPIVGGKELQVIRESVDYTLNKDWYVKILNEDFYINNNASRPMVSNWGMYSPEVILSLLQEEEIKKIIDNKHYGKYSLKTSMYPMYKKIWQYFYIRLPQTGLENDQFPWLLPDALLNFFQQKIQKNKQFIAPIYFNTFDFIKLFNS
jgi:hypothetical protein